MLNRNLSRAWLQWFEEAGERRTALLETARRALRYLINRRLAAGWLAWRDAVARQWRAWVVVPYIQGSYAVPIKRRQAKSAIDKPSDYADVYTISVGAAGAIFCAGRDSSIRQLDPSDGRCLHRLEGHIDGVNALTTMNDELLASGSGDTTIRLWRTSAKNVTDFGTLRGHKKAVTALQPLSSRQLVSGSQDQSVRLWDLRRNGGCIATVWMNEKAATSLSERPRTQINNNPACAVQSLAMVSASREQVAAGLWTGEIRLVDLNRSRIISTLDAHAGAVWATLNPDAMTGHGTSSQLVSAGSDGVVRMWDIRASGREAVGSMVGTLGSDRSTGGAIYAMAERDGLLLTGGSDHLMRVWDRRMAGRCLFELPGHTDSIQCVAFQDSSMLLSGGKDGAVRFWQLNAAHSQPRQRGQDSRPRKPQAQRRAGRTRNVKVQELASTSTESGPSTPATKGAS